MASEQASKMRMGQNSMITTFFNNYTLVHLDCNPLIVTVVLSAEDGGGDVGAVLSSAGEIKSLLAPVQARVEALNLNSED